MLQRLEIADAVRGKTRLGDAGYVVEPVARGEIELGVQQITEILPVPGGRLVGPLPEPLQTLTVYAVAPTPQARDPEAVRAFLDYLRGDAGRACFTARGVAPP